MTQLLGGLERKLPITLNLTAHVNAPGGAKVNLNVIVTKDINEIAPICLACQKTETSSLELQRITSPIYETLGTN